MLYNNTKSIKFRIILYSSLMILIIGSISNIYLYYKSNDIIDSKLDQINQMNIDQIDAALIRSISSIKELSLLITNHSTIQRTLEYNNPNSTKARLESVDAQSIITNYVDSSLVAPYITKAVLFNDNDLLIASVNTEMGTLDDYELIVNSPLMKDIISEKNNYQLITDPILSSGLLCMPLLYPIYSLSSSEVVGWLYMEVDTALFTDMIENYSIYEELGFITSTNNYISTSSSDLRNDNNHFTQNQLPSNYISATYPLTSLDWTLYTLTDLDTVNIERQELLNQFILLLVAIFITAVILSVVMSNIITKPIKLLKRRIQKISKGHFGKDPITDTLPGEIGEIGSVVDQMAQDMETLLEESIDLTKKKKDYEIAMLQSQMNPHFLYNTLNSIHWMASLQKNTGICNLVDALTHLLKNVANNASDKVALGDELKLLEDYITIQSIRYMESFEFINQIPQDLHSIQIPKFTLQPLVENAIFHGIEPSGSFGTITADACTQSGILYINITDNGIGMTSEEIRIMKSKQLKKADGSLSGIGYKNVDSRLKLIYGETYGLKVDSVKNQYTKITIMIPIEGDSQLEEMVSHE